MTRQSQRSQASTNGRWVGVSSAEGKRTERFSQKSSRYSDSLKSEVRLPRDLERFSYESNEQVSLYSRQAEPEIRENSLNSEISQKIVQFFSLLHSPPPAWNPYGGISVIDPDF